MERLASSPDFRIHQLANDAEIETYFRLNAQTFRAREDSEAVAKCRRRFITQDPRFRPQQLRGAFLGDTLVGGYILLERSLSLGDITLNSVGCLGGLCTHSDYRHQGIATALLQDMLRFAGEQEHTFVLLHGIPYFYHQFGFIDVLEDMPQHSINRLLIPTQPDDGYTVRPCRADDDEEVRAILTLYQEQQSTSFVSFAPHRTIEQQKHYLRNWFEVNNTPPMVAVDPDRQVQGYLMLSRRWGHIYAYEVAARTWSAALALLRYHSSLLDTAEESPDQLEWPLPFYTHTYYLLANHIPLSSHVYSQPNQGWMARITHMPTVSHLLQARWQASCAAHSLSQSTHPFLVITTLNDEKHTIELQPASAESDSTGDFTDTSHFATYALSSQALTQFFFGFRPVLSAISQVEVTQASTGEAKDPLSLSPLAKMFPTHPAWIAGSDLF